MQDPLFSHDVAHIYCFQPRQNLLAAASRVGEASHDIMDGVGEYAEDLDKAYQVHEYPLKLGPLPIWLSG